MRDTLLLFRLPCVYCFAYSMYRAWSCILGKCHRNKEMLTKKHTLSTRKAWSCTLQMYREQKYRFSLSYSQTSWSPNIDGRATELAMEQKRRHCKQFPWWRKCSRQSCWHFRSSTCFATSACDIFWNWQCAFVVLGLPHSGHQWEF